MEKRDFIKALAFGSMGGAAAVALGGGGTTASPALGKYQQRFQEILDTNSFRAGWISYQPFFWQDTNSGQMQGIFYDLTMRLADLAGLSVTWAPETTFATVATDLDAGKFDVHCGGLWPELRRARLVNFSDAPFYSGLEVYIAPRLQQQNATLESLKTGRFKMATIDGEMSSIIQRTDFNNAPTYSLPANSDISALLEALATGHADFTVVERTVALEYLHKNPDKIVRLPHSKPIRVFPNSFAVARDNLPMMNLIEVGLRELLFSGVVEQTLQKYEKVPHSLFRVVSTVDAGEQS